MPPNAKCGKKVKKKSKLLNSGSMSFSLVAFRLRSTLNAQTLRYFDFAQYAHGLTKRH
jgi:hypothetical protein